MRRSRRGLTYLSRDAQERRGGLRQAAALCGSALSHLALLTTLLHFSGQAQPPRPPEITVDLALLAPSRRVEAPVPDLAEVARGQAGRARPVQSETQDPVAPDSAEAQKVAALAVGTPEPTAGPAVAEAAAAPVEAREVAAPETGAEVAAPETGAREVPAPQAEVVPAEVAEAVAEPVEAEQVAIAQAAALEVPAQQAEAVPAEVAEAAPEPAEAEQVAASEPTAPEAPARLAEAIAAEPAAAAPEPVEAGEVAAPQAELPEAPSQLAEAVPAAPPKVAADQIETAEARAPPGPAPAPERAPLAESEPPGPVAPEPAPAEALAPQSDVALIPSRPSRLEPRDLAARQVAPLAAETAPAAPAAPAAAAAPASPAGSAPAAPPELVASVEEPPPGAAAESAAPPVVAEEQVALAATPPKPPTLPSAPAPRERADSPSSAAGRPPSPDALLARLEAMQDESLRAKEDPELWQVIRAVRRQIARCWTLDGEDARRFRVDIDVTFGREGQLLEALIKRPGKLVDDEAFREFALGAQRALRSCSPFDLPEESYDLWQRFTMRFIARNGRS